MKRIIFHIMITIFSINTVMAQNIDLSQPIPIDNSIKKGVLSNGLTYYIKSTDVVKNAASYYIIQNVGSILENEDQRGLAHFLEHMAFNGTENFPGKAIINSLQEHGAVFGKDINAYTSFDETVYNLNNIPTKEGLIDTCLTILNDWSNYLLLTDEEIDAERGVIKEEWRTRQNGQMRLFENSLPTTYNNSKYADRVPIGLMSVVESFDYKALRDFYHDWYRTDLQAIAIIGDVDVNEIEQKIIKKFSKIPAVKNPKERYQVDIPDNEEMLYNLGMDSEVSTSKISFGIRHNKNLKIETVEDLKQQLLESMAASMLNARISEQEQKPEATFLKGIVSYSGSSRSSNTFKLWLMPKENQQQEAFSQVFTELIRAVKFGFTPSEIERRITQIENAYENKIAKKDDVSHLQIERKIQNNYLNNETMSDIDEEYGIVKQLLDDITKEDLHKTIKRFYTENNRYLNVTGVEGEDNLTKTQAKKIISELENDSSITPYTEQLEGKDLVSNLNIKEGVITNEKVNSDIGSTTFTLSNDIKVHYKFVDKDENEVTLKAVSYGGKSLLNDKDLPSANLLRNLIQKSGLGDYSSTDLRKILAGKTANVGVGLGAINESVSGRSNTRDVETMLQMVHLYFEKPRFDNQAYQVLVSNIDNYITQRSKDVGEKMKDSLTVALYGKNNPKKPLFNDEYAEKISFEKIKSIYKDRFADASDFEFFIVGDVEKDQLKPLLEKYIASIPTNGTKEEYKDNTAKWLSKTIEKDVFIEMENPKASVNIAYKKEMPFSLKKSIYTRALGDILQLRITETVRESIGGAYSPRASARFYREPTSMGYISFNFDTDPNLADELITVVKGELQKIASGNIKEEDLNKVKESFLKGREQSKNRNSFDMQLLTSFFRYGYNRNDPKNFKNIVESMTTQDIKKITQDILKNAKSYEIIFKPKLENN